MKILPFPPRPTRSRDLGAGLLRLERYLGEYRVRQAALGRDGRRLAASIERLQALVRDVTLQTAVLRRSASRLRTAGRTTGRPDA